jgi:hypothetical protein
MAERCSWTGTCRSRSASSSFPEPRRTGRWQSPSGSSRPSSSSPWRSRTAIAQAFLPILAARAHYLNFAVWLFALVHGLTAGTDAFTTWALMLYAGSAWLVLALTVHRATAHLGGQAARN